MTGQSDMLAPAPPFDVVVDLSASGMDAPRLAAHARELAGISGLPFADGRVLIVPPAPLAENPPAEPLPAGFAWTGTARALRRALAGAAAHRRGLVVVSGDWLPGIEAMAQIAALGDADPMIGTVQPRFADPETDRVAALPGISDKAPPDLPRAALARLPALAVTAELPAALVFVTPQAVRAAASMEEATEAGFAEALEAFLVALRRLGFRNLVSNRTVMPCPGGAAVAYPAPSSRASKHQADALQGRQWLAEQPERTLERTLAEGFDRFGRPRLLLDCRGLTARHNGTAQAILGFLGGMEALRTPGFAITALVSGAAARFHDLRRRFPGLAFEIDRPKGRYFATAVLDQPWSVRSVFETHRISAVIAFNILDTIAWDIVYAAPERLDEAWRVAANLSDGLLFNSHFTRERFAFRFNPDPAIPLAVTHHSLARAELVAAPPASPYAEPFLFVVGNDYDHKDVTPTLARLADAFPYTRIVALGGASAGNPRVTILRSGHIAESDIQALLANAAAVVFPSFYEGFGLPVAQGAAYGRTVVVRRSPLWEELAAHSRLPGAIVPFDDEASLVEGVGRALHGLPPCALPSGGALEPDQSGPTWANCAQRILDLMERAAANFDGRRWLLREALFRTLRQAKP
ncbi:glycosyltransferase [Bosea sp. 117]|uniref:glycosyltransferase n=1 Tax=Bosea sp. 117 TaxID=1125973 RepID=UPI000571BE61|nr:glycosyltransferase [Bosea sp. 117]